MLSFRMVDSFLDAPGGSIRPGLLRRLRFVLAAGLLIAACCHGLTAWLTHRGDGPPQTAWMPAHPGSPGEGKAFRAYTDRGRPVSLVSYPDRPPTADTLAAEEQWLRKSGLSAVLVSTGPPTAAHVCHDWVFTGGRFAMIDASIEAILEDNGYERIAAPQVGDLAVYRNRAAGGIMHTGIVHSIGKNRVVRVESKWAWMGRYIHAADVFCCPNSVCTFYRSARSGHLLAGLDGGMPPNPDAVALLSRKPAPPAAQTANPPDGAHDLARCADMRMGSFSYRGGRGTYWSGSKRWKGRGSLNDGMKKRHMTWRQKREWLS